MKPREMSDEIHRHLVPMVHSYWRIRPSTHSLLGKSTRMDFYGAWIGVGFNINCVDDEVGDSNETE